MPAKATLSKVVHRKPEPFMPYAHVPEYLLCFVTETLACGHMVTIDPDPDPLIARYRRCHECDAGKVAPISGAKKPVESVRLPMVEKKLA